MNLDKELGIAKCPYWRDIAHFGGVTLGLCGAKSMEEDPLRAGEKETTLLECPWFSKRIAHEVPAIVEVGPVMTSLIDEDVRRKLGLQDNEVILHPVVKKLASKPGEEGIMELKGVWDRFVDEWVEEFKKDQ